MGWNHPGPGRFDADPKARHETLGPFYAEISAWPKQFPCYFCQPSLLSSNLAGHRRRHRCPQLPDRCHMTASLSSIAE